PTRARATVTACRASAPLSDKLEPVTASAVPGSRYRERRRVRPGASRGGPQVQEPIAELGEKSLLELGEPWRRLLADRRELGDQLVFARVQPGRDEHLHADLQIAAATAAEPGDAAVFDRDDLRALGARPDLQLHVAVESPDL